MSNIGTSFDSWLEEENIKEEVEANAWKKVIAWQIQKEMKQRKLTKTKMAEELHTSRSQLDRLLDEDNKSITLLTLEHAANVLGKKLKIQLI